MVGSNSKIMKVVDRFRDCISRSLQTRTVLQLFMRKQDSTKEKPGVLAMVNHNTGMNMLEQPNHEGDHMTLGNVSTKSDSATLYP